VTDFGLSMKSGANPGGGGGGAGGAGGGGEEPKPGKNSEKYTV
jgi:hypothetical protein